MNYKDHSLCSLSLAKATHFLTKQTTESSRNSLTRGFQVQAESTHFG